MLLRTILPVIALACRNTNALAGGNLRSCDESFPLAPPSPPDGQNDRRRHLFSSWRRERRLVAIPPGDRSREYYETGEYYAPLCPDGRRIDIRKLYRCNAGSCWNECISQCTFECTWNEPTPKPTRLLTQTPSFQLTEKEVPLLLSLSGIIPEAYRMSENVRAAIIRYLYNKLNYDIKGSPYGLKLLELTYPGILLGRPHDLPLSAKMRGPSDVMDFALPNLQQLVRDSREEIVANLKSLDGTGGEAFKDLTLVVDTYNFGSIIFEELSDPPSISNTPTIAPEPVKVLEAETLEEDTIPTKTIPWWVWLIAASVILLCCICCVCFCLQRHRKASDKKDVEQEQQSDEITRRRTQHLRRPSLGKSWRVWNKKEQEQQSDEITRSRVQRPRRPSLGKSWKVRNKKDAERGQRSDEMASRAQRTRRASLGRSWKTKKSLPRNITVERASDQNRRSRRPKRTESGKRSAHKKRSHNKYPSHDSPTLATGVELPQREVNLETEASRVAETWAAKDLDAETAVSALPAGFDPPEETAIVLQNCYNPQPRNARQARDPTYYTDDKVNPIQAEPEGDKADDSLMSDVRRKSKGSRRKRKAKNARSGQRDDTAIVSRESPDPNEEMLGDDQGYFQSERIYYEREDSSEGRNGHAHEYHQSGRILSEPEGMLSSDLSTKGKKKSRKKSGKKRKSSPKSRMSQMGERVRSSFKWNTGPIDIELDGNGSVDDSPGILTNHPPGMEQQQQAGASSRNAAGYHKNGERRSRSRANASKKKKGRVRKSIFASITRRSSDFVRDGISSEDESYHG